MTWDQNAYELQRMSGALLETQCPGCTLNTGALVADDDGPWKTLICPGCRHEWTEET